MANTKSPARQMMIEFIKATRENPVFSFKIKGNEESAKSFVHRMRVELSRMREVVIQKGETPRPFKVKMQTVEYDRKTDSTIVTLKKEQGVDVQIATDIQSIFNEISGGLKI